jgi:membrane-bound inhibitor of C-type lysozyme
MNTLTCGAAVVLLLLAVSPKEPSTELRITVLGDGRFIHKSFRFTCDNNGGRLGLPPGTFTVEYVNGSGNSLALIPINGRTLILANVVSGSGARYAADRYTWSDGGARGAFLWSDLLGVHDQTSCRRVE